MKTRIAFCLLTLLFFNSCIVNSLFPFFTEDTISFEPSFLGIWKDGKNNGNRWIVNSVEDISKIKKASVNDFNFYNKYKKGYFVVYEEKNENRTSIFLAMPFKINDQVFLDFVPFIYDEDLNSLVSYHLVPVHSLVKFDVLDKKTIDIKWLSSNKLATLIEGHKIKIKHEKVGVDDSNYLLTAPTVELQKFIKKFMDSKDEYKWKTDVEFNLKRTHSKTEALELIKNVINKETKLSGNLF